MCSAWQCCYFPYSSGLKTGQPLEWKNRRRPPQLGINVHIPVSQHPFPDVANIAIFYHFAIELRLPFPAAAINKECEAQHISQQGYLDSHGIAKHQYYRWKRRYREEDEQSLVPARFVGCLR